MASCIGSGSAALFWTESLTQISRAAKGGTELPILGSQKIHALLYGR